MALNQTDQIVIMQSSTMQTRCSSAVAKYALFLLNGTPTTEQEAWARGAMDGISAMGQKVSVYILSDSNFLADGSGITDNQLQGAIEVAINNHFILS